MHILNHEIKKHVIRTPHSEEQINVKMKTRLWVLVRLALIGDSKVSMSTF